MPCPLEHSLKTQLSPLAAFNSKGIIENILIFRIPGLPGRNDSGISSASQKEHHKFRRTPSPQHLSTLSDFSCRKILLPRLQSEDSRSILLSLLAARLTIRRFGKLNYRLRTKYLRNIIRQQEFGANLSRNVPSPSTNRTALFVFWLLLKLSSSFNTFVMSVPSDVHETRDVVPVKLRSSYIVKMLHSSLRVYS